MATENYKRTVSGTVGAGMGALFNGGGRTYYILEHKTNSKYHRAGESQKIIIDEIELGRDANCQVRFDESFDTVSRRHASIVRDGDNWKLIHLSHSNPTLVNGRPIQGTYYLQSGDEIQLASNGPRLGFIVPQGKQALTSSIGLTERMSLFRQQALRPYRRGLWILSALLLAAILGFGYWNWTLSKDNEALRQEMASYQVQLDSLATQKAALQTEEAQLQAQIKANPNDQQAQQRLVVVRRNLVSTDTQIRNVSQKIQETGNRLKEVYDDDEPEAEPTPAEAAPTAANPEENIGTASSAAATEAAPQTKEDIRDYYDRIYSIKVKRITLERNGESHDAGIAVNQMEGGTGFMLSNGTFVTARQNIQPWYYIGDSKTGWRYEMAKAVAAGFDVIIEYDAYSVRGTAKKLSFNNRDFVVDQAGDVKTMTIEVEKKDWIRFSDLGFTIDKSERIKSSDITIAGSASRSYALLPGVGLPGLPYDAGASQGIAGGQDVTVAGFSGVTDVHNLSNYIEYKKSSTARADNANGTIVLQDAFSGSGMLGAPAFYLEADGTYRVIGVMVGNLGGKARLVPIYLCN